MAYEGQQYGQSPFKPQANYYAPRPSAPRPSGRRSSRSPMIRQAIAQVSSPDAIIHNVILVPVDSPVWESPAQLT